MGADRFTLTMYLVLGTEKGISTSTREDRVSDETVFREARSVMSLNKKKLILSKFFWSVRKQNNSRYSSSHWKYPTELCEYKLKLRWNTCLCHKITIRLYLCCKKSVYNTKTLFNSQWRSASISTLEVQWRTG